MSLRARLSDELKASMKAGNSARTSTIRMILARFKEVDIAARPSGVDKVADDDLMPVLRNMVKSRRESIELYRQGNRQDLVDKEAAEVDVIESFLPAQMDPAAVEQAVTEAVQATGASTIKDMGRVMAKLKEKHGAILDMSVAGPLVRARLQAA